jgi:hypothetical protein
MVGGAAAAGVPALIIRSNGRYSRLLPPLHIHDHLAGLGQHLLHRLQINALAGHLRGLQVLGQHRVEAGDLTGRLADHLFPVGLGVLHSAGRGAAGGGHHLLRIGVRLVLDARLVLAGLDGVVEGVLHLLRRLGRLHVDAGHQQAGAIAEVLHRGLGLVGEGYHPTADELLHAPLDAVGDGAAPLGEDEVQIALADGLAHHAFGGVADGLVRGLVLEQVVHRILHPELHGELDIHDVLIAGEHLRLVAEGGELLHVDLHHVFDGEWQVPVETGVGHLREGAEAQHHPLLRRGHGVESGGQPRPRPGRRRSRRCRPDSVPRVRRHRRPADRCRDRPTGRRISLAGCARPRPDRGAVFPTLPAPGVLVHHPVCSRAWTSPLIMAWL